jgi:ABC-type lipopolysaccharide export system ATPase subunit
VPEPLRNKGSLLEVEKVSFKYPNSDKLILDNVTLNVQPGDRIGIVGANGGYFIFCFCILVKLINVSKLPYVQKAKAKPLLPTSLRADSQPLPDKYYTTRTPP